ncbi:hypothetical protein SAMN05661080_03153 [Modestobacter sp. DSM 44400]|uniref:hypothetical protein n=1 Tax=Modestobacter sp. DSM 44400 TaxID=1550230 RepID=UPI0008983DA7|nr:hypothetical protein [Modestobacter sp. DSM 44400]SDY34642.1 hypothetical protein SAMN05661080_03153 [Modestobacter sp. DSM 44400]
MPGKVGAHLLPGADPTMLGDVARLNAPVHWGHGIAMGALRDVFDVPGLSGPAASAAHFALVWGRGRRPVPSAGHRRRAVALER